MDGTLPLIFTAYHLAGIDYRWSVVHNRQYSILPRLALIGAG
jgi:hypothetical protein